MMDQNHVLFSSHQTELISQSRNSASIATNTHPTVSNNVGQFALTQRLVNEVRTTSLIPQRVQVVQTFNIDYFPVQNQTSLAASSPFGDRHEFCVTEFVRTQELVRTQLLSSASTRERFLGPNHDHYAAWGTSQAQANPPNQVINHPIFNSTSIETQSFHNLVHNFGHNYGLNQCFNGSKSFSNNTHFENPSYEQYSSPQYVPSPGSNQNPPIRNQSATLRLIENDEPIVVDVEPLNVIFPADQTKNPIPTQNKLPSSNDDELHNLLFNIDDYNTGHHHDHQQDHNTSFEEGDHDESDNDKLEAGDGRTHSLPYKKYGPYTCPKCKGLFMTSQLFAAHMGSHYKYESAEQRRKRHLAKYGRKKHLRLVNSREGLTLIPEQPPKEVVVRENKINNVGHTRNNITKVVDDKEESGHEIVVEGSSQLEGLFDVPIKEEPLEMIS